MSAARRLDPQSPSSPSTPAGIVRSMSVQAASSMTGSDLLAQVGTDPAQGLRSAEVAARRAVNGPNLVAVRPVGLLEVLWHQVRSPLLALLVTAAVASYFVGERSDAVIIAVIVAMSVGLGLVNEYRAERAAERLHSQVRHGAVAVRDGRPTAVDVTELVPGDVVHLRMGDVVAADMRLLSVDGLECDESVLTGESLAVAKAVDPVPPGTALAELSGCALMGTVVHAGSGRGLVVATGGATIFGEVAAGLSTREPDTAFTVGLRRFSQLLVYVAGSLTGAIFVINVVLARPLLDALLFSLAIAVGITPQLLPAVVSTSLAAGSRRMRRLEVLVKRLVCIEDLGDVDVVFTDKTGTLTLGRTRFMRAVPTGEPRGGAHSEVLLWGLLCTETEPGGQVGAGGQTGAVGANALDDALWSSPAAVRERSALGGYERVGVLGFDHERRMVSVVVRSPEGACTLVTKGAPEAVLARCVDVPASSRDALGREFAAGNRVVAVATRPTSVVRPTAEDERDLQLQGLLVFLDPPKPDAAPALQRLAELGIDVKVVTGDNAQVAVRVCEELGLLGTGSAGAALTGPEIDGLDDQQLAAAIVGTTVFARVSPEQKARIVRVRRHASGGVAFLGDGVNDALALHAADVGISVDSAADVAKDAADVLLLRKDLHVLADGVAEGRRIFANTLKYVLMGTSSNFGNMVSAAGASLFLPFLPMLPSQILLNNLLYDASQLAIPTDTVDPEQLHRPSHWDIGFIRRFMLVFGPVSSVFDFLTFAVMLRVFHAGAPEFRTGWFVESLATQTLIIFAIRTRRVPFVRSHPSLPLTLAALGAVGVGALLPVLPVAHLLGFEPLPAAFFGALALMVVAYLVLIEAGKRVFYRARPGPLAAVAPATGPHRVRRRAARFARQTPRGPQHMP